MELMIFFFAQVKKKNVVVSLLATCLENFTGNLTWRCSEVCVHLRDDVDLCRNCVKMNINAQI